MVATHIHYMLCVCVCVGGGGGGGAVALLLYYMYTKTNFFCSVNNSLHFSYTQLIVGTRIFPQIKACWHSIIPA